VYSLNREYLASQDIGRSRNIAWDSLMVILGDKDSNPNLNDDLLKTVELYQEIRTLCFNYQYVPENSLDISLEESLDNLSSNYSFSALSNIAEKIKIEGNTSIIEYQRYKHERMDSQHATTGKLVETINLCSEKLWIVTSAMQKNTQ
jgi:hypothetical protein